MHLSRWTTTPDCTSSSWPESSPSHSLTLVNHNETFSHLNYCIYVFGGVSVTKHCGATTRKVAENIPNLRYKIRKENLHFRREVWLSMKMKMVQDNTTLWYPRMRWFSESVDFLIITSYLCGKYLEITQILNLQDSSEHSEDGLDLAGLYRS